LHLGDEANTITWRWKMAVVKMNVSLDAETAHALRRCAAESHKPISRYLADLIQADARKRLDALAAEGYRALSGDTAKFAAEAWPIAAETWPEWAREEGGADAHAG
jgi:hypothetical protein